MITGSTYGFIRYDEIVFKKIMGFDISYRNRQILVALEAFEFKNYLKMFYN